MSSDYANHDILSFLSKNMVIIIIHRPDTLSSAEYRIEEIESICQAYAHANIS